MIKIISLLALTCAFGAHAEQRPCGIRSVNYEESSHSKNPASSGYISIGFYADAYWHYSRDSINYISNGMVSMATIDEGSNEKIYIVKSSHLRVPEDQELKLWIPHISCIVNFALDQDPPGIYITENFSGVVGNEKREKMFYGIEQFESK